MFKTGALGHAPIQLLQHSPLINLNDMDMDDMDASPAEPPINRSLGEVPAAGPTEVVGNGQSTISSPPLISPEAGQRYPIPGLPEGYYCSLQPSLGPMFKLTKLKVLVDRRNTASLGLFIVIFFGLTLTLLAVGEALQLALPEASPTLEMVMTLGFLLLLTTPIALAAMLGIALGQVIRQPKHRINPDLERVWLLRRGQNTIGKLRLLPEALRQQLLWVYVEPKYRDQGIGQAFVRTVLAAEGKPCRVKVSQDSLSKNGQTFLQGCGFQLPPDQNSAQRESRWRKSNSIWLTYCRDLQH